MAGSDGLAASFRGQSSDKLVLIDLLARVCVLVCVRVRLNPRLAETFLGVHCVGSALLRGSGGECNLRTRARRAAAASAATSHKRIYTAKECAVKTATYKSEKGNKSG